MHTPNAVAAVRGTKFDTAFFRPEQVGPTFGDCHNFTDVAVQDGAVNLATGNNPGGGINIEAGYEATVPCFLAPTGCGSAGDDGSVVVRSGWGSQFSRRDYTGGPGAATGLSDVRQHEYLAASSASATPAARMIAYCSI